MSSKSLFNLLFSPSLFFCFLVIYLKQLACLTCRVSCSLSFADWIPELKFITFLIFPYKLISIDFKMAVFTH